MTESTFDYARQEWTSGERARSLRNAQLIEELELLESPDAAAYLKFVGSAYTVDEARAEFRRRLLEARS